MKLGSQTNSLVNHIYSRATKGQPTPEIGMGVTLLGWTDRYPATIIGIIENGKYIIVQSDNYKRIDNNGMSECQEYEYTANLDGATYTFKMNPNGGWSEVFRNPETGRFKKYNGGKGLRIGYREKYHDFSF